MSVEMVPIVCPGVMYMVSVVSPSVSFMPSVTTMSRRGTGCAFGLAFVRSSRFQSSSVSSTRAL
jgi:hypothetical protein